MIAALVLAAVRSVAIDIGLALAALCVTSILIASGFAFLMRHRRREHISRRGHP